MSILLEVCIDSIESAFAAKAGGADRLEVCSSLATGGLTPSFGLVKKCIEDVQLPVMMMIRPHDGSFIYSAADLDTMLHDIRIGHTLGVDGFVFGVLNEQDTVHRESNRLLLDAADSLDATFHRAFDVSPNPLATLDEIADLGFSRLLTSGQATTAEEGIPLLMQLYERASGKIAVMPGGGVNAENAERIVRETGATELHASASISRVDPSENSFGFGGNRRNTDSQRVRAIKHALHVGIEGG